MRIWMKSISLALCAVILLVALVGCRGITVNMGNVNANGGDVLSGNQGNNGGAESGTDTETDSGTDSDTGTDTGADTGPETETGSGSESESGTSVGTWIEKDDTVYVGMTSVALREGPGSSYGKITSVNSGTALERKETNGTWDKVIYDGTECYVMHALVSTDAKDFQFDLLATEDRVALTIAQGKQINLRTTPFIADVPSDDMAYTANVGISGLGSTSTPHDAAANPLIKVGVSKNGNWYQVEYKGNTYFITKYIVTTGAVIDPSVPAGSGDGNGNG